MATAGLLTALGLEHAIAAAPYRPIVPGMPATDQTVTLSGHDLTVDQVVAVARYGQTVEATPEARRHQEDAHALLLEGALEGMPIIGFNRRGAAGDVVLFDGDPAAPEVAAMLQRRAMASFESAAAPAGAAQITEEEGVRALMVVRANTLTYSPASAPVLQMMVDFLNSRITPVAALPGASGGPETALAGIAAAMVGKGDAYYHGIRVAAAQALSQAGLTPLVPVDADYAALTDTDAYDIGRTALLLADGRRALEWADLIFAMDMNGMNAAIAPLSLPAQANRPYKWTYWDAARVLDMLKGSYLFDDGGASVAGSPPRAVPASLTLSPTRQGAAWRAWGALRDATLIALNSSDQSPAFRLGLSPRESPELSTPQMMKYFVKGGKANGGKRGYIVPALNRDPYPMANEITFFTTALGMLDLAVAQRTGASLPGALPPLDEGMVAIGHARQAVDATFGLLALDMVAAARLLDERAAEDSARAFGTAPTAAWAAFRIVVPAQAAGDTALAGAWQFLQNNHPATFYPKGGSPPGTDDPIPLAQEKLKP
ncbi:MAG: histidine ammonia-lyase [Rhodospirillales bacterium]|nr:histidine ammonia-lyase [Rhodospirillales bacterium]